MLGKPKPMKKGNSTNSAQNKRPRVKKNKISNTTMDEPLLNNSIMASEPAISEEPNLLTDKGYDPADTSAQESVTKIDEYRP